jgi:hypothetical protein
MYRGPHTWAADFFQGVSHFRGGGLNLSTPFLIDNLKKIKKNKKKNSKKKKKKIVFFKKN